MNLFPRLHDPRAVALVTARYAPALGGAEHYVEMIARGLVRRGIPVEVVTTDPTALLPSHERRDGVAVHRFRTVANDSVYYLAPRLGWWLLRNAHRYQLIHAFSYHTPLALQSGLVSCLTRTPLVLTTFYHGGGHTSFRRLLHIPYGLLGRRIVRQASQVVCLTDAERTLVRGLVGDLGRATRLPAVLVPPGVEAEEIRQAEAWPCRSDTVTILAGGRLEEYKQTDRLVPVLALLPPRYRLVITGDGPLLSRIRQLARQYGVEARIDLLGHVDRPTLRRWYRSADIFVTLSRHESFGMTVLEAAAAGAPVVASDIPPHRDLTGYLPPDRLLFVHPDASPSDVAQVIQTARARGRASDTTGWPLPTWDDAIEATIASYRTALRRQPPGATGLPLSQVSSCSEHPARSHS